MALSFNGATKVITLGSGDDQLSVRELWTQWVNWWVSGDNSKYAMAMSQVGGQTIDASAGTLIPIYVFLENGWRLKPREANHTVNVGDGVLLVEGGGDPFINTTGAYVVRINYQQPVQAISFDAEGGGGGTGLTPAQVWSHIVENGLTAEEILRILISVMAGKATGLEGGTPVFRDLSDSKNRVTGTIVKGNRDITGIDGT